MVQHRQELMGRRLYGLFMDEMLLADKGLRPTDIRPASLPGFALRIGARAALVPTPAGQVHSLSMKLSHADILPEPLSPDERNAEYAAKLGSLAERVGLPGDYVEFIQ